MCQDWINKNGLFVWIFSDTCKHLTIKCQEQDLRLGTGPGDLIRTWVQVGAQASRKVHPCVQCCHLCQHLSLINSALAHEFTRPMNSDTADGGVPTKPIVPRRWSPGFWGHTRKSWRNCGSSPWGQKLSRDYNPGIFEGLSNGKGTGFLLSGLPSVIHFRTRIKEEVTGRK